MHQFLACALLLLMSARVFAGPMKGTDPAGDTPGNTPAGTPAVPIEMIEAKTADHGFAISAQNKTDFPVTVNVDFSHIENFQCNVKMPVSVMVQPRKKQLIARLAHGNARLAASYNLQWTYFYGFRTEKQDQPPYELPYSAGYAYVIAQGFNGPFSHQGRNAVDFALPQGSTICAARDGTVVEVVQSFIAGGIDDNLKSKANRILILHEDGTVGHYAHLVHDGAKVKVGQKVRAGDAIGLSGATGYARGPHLHFEIDRPPMVGNETESITMQFVARAEDGSAQTVDPKEGDLLMRPIPKGDPNAARKLPLNAVESLLTCRMVNEGELVDITDRFSAQEPMYVTFRCNCTGFHTSQILIYKDDGADKSPAVFEQPLSKQSAGRMYILKLDLPDEQSKIRGKCIARVTIDNEVVASVRFDVGS